MIPSENGIIISPTEPTVNRRKVWMQKSEGNNKIYVLNDNNEYEEFIKQYEEVYSTEEQLIGKWHNGHNVYRKVLLIDVSSFEAEQECSINYADYGINGNIIVHDYRGLCQRTDSLWQVLPCTLEGWHIDIYDFRETRFTIKVSQNQKRVGLMILTLVLEYEYTI